MERGWISTGSPALTGTAGPLAKLGPASRACLGAGFSERPVSIDAASLQREVDLLIGESMAPVALKLAEGLTGVDPATVELLRARTVEMQVRSMAAELAARRVFILFEEKGVPGAVIKGPAVARFYSPGWPRTHSDIDLLVPSCRFEEVVALCREEGFTDPASTPPWPWFDAVCKESVNLHSADGGNIDVHHHVPPWIFGARLTPETVIGASRVGEVAGRPVRLAKPEHSLVIAALHIVNDLWKGRIGLASWRDIIVLLRLVGAERAEAVFSEMRIEWLLTLVVISLRRAVPEVELPAVRSAHRAPVSAKGRLAALGWNGDSSFTRQRVTFAARLPLPNAGKFIAGCIVPQPSYVHEYYGSYRGYWRSLVGETISTVRGGDPRMNSVLMTKLER